MFAYHPTCEDGGGNHFALLGSFDSIEADLIFSSREQAGQGVVGHIAVNHYAVYSTWRKTTDGGWALTVTLMLRFFLRTACCLANWRAFYITGWILIKWELQLKIQLNIADKMLQLIRYSGMCNEVPVLKIFYIRQTCNTKCHVHLTVTKTRSFVVSGKKINVMLL